MKAEGNLFKALNKYAGKYEISFQMWGQSRYTIYIAKDGVDLTSMGGYETAGECMQAALEYLDRITTKRDK